MNRKTVPVLVLSSLSILATAGCMVAADWPYGTVYGAPMEYGTAYGPPMEYGYAPQLYNGYVVYYTDYGIPFYWLGGGQVWLPAPARPRYTEYWRRHQPAYNNWYAQRGQYYQGRRFTDREGNRPGPVNGPGAAPYRQHQNWQNQASVPVRQYPQTQSQGWAGQHQPRVQPQTWQQPVGVPAGQRQAPYQGPYQPGQRQIWGRTPHGQVPDQTPDRAVQPQTWGPARQNQTPDQAGQHQTWRRTRQNPVPDRAEQQQTSGPPRQSPAPDQAAQQQTWGPARQSPAPDQAAQQQTWGPTRQDRDPTQYRRQWDPSAGPRQRDRGPSAPGPVQ